MKFSQEPRTKVYCLGMKLNVSNLVYPKKLKNTKSSLPSFVKSLSFGSFPLLKKHRSWIEKIFIHPARTNSVSQMRARLIYVDLL